MSTGSIYYLSKESILRIRSLRTFFKPTLYTYDIALKCIENSAQYKCPSIKETQSIRHLMFIKSRYLKKENVCVI